MASSFSGSSRSIRSRVDRFIDTRWMPKRAIAACWRAASSKTHSVSWRTKPVCSAKGMNCIGGTSPRVGCCQRTSASAPTSAPVASATLGCRYRRSSSLSTAWRSSDSSDSVCALPLSRLASYSCAPAVWRLATYIATSARDSSVSASAACSGQQAMPRPALRSTRWSSSVSGCSKAAAMRAATRLRRRGVGAGQQQGKFVAAQPRHQVLRAHHLLQPFAPRPAAAGRRRRSRARR